MARPDREAAGRRFDRAGIRALDRSERPQRPRNGSVSIAALEALQRGDFDALNRCCKTIFTTVIASNKPGGCGDRRAASGRRDATRCWPARARACSRSHRSARRSKRSLSGSTCRDSLRTLLDARCDDAASGLHDRDAVVLAGGPTDAVAALQPGAPNKAFVEIGGVTLVGRVLAALRARRRSDASSSSRRANVRGHADLALADELRPDGVRITESLRNGLEGLPPDDDALGRRVRSAGSHAAPRSTISSLGVRGARCRHRLWLRREERAPEPLSRVPHTWARLRDGTFCGGGIVGDQTARAAAARTLHRALGRRAQIIRFGWLRSSDGTCSPAIAVGRLTIAQPRRARDGFSARRCARCIAVSRNGRQRGPRQRRRAGATAGS